MRNLIILNCSVAGLLSAAVIGLGRYEGVLFLPLTLLLVTFLGLSIVNLAAPIFLWKNHGPRSLFAPLSFIVAAIVCYEAAAYGPRLASAGTPASPDTFLRGSTQADLERIARQLLNQGFSEIETYASRSTWVHMSPRLAAKDLPPGVDARLRAYGFERTSVDDLSGVVTFKYDQLRTWYEYVYATNSLAPPYSTRPILAEGDLGDWRDIRPIAEWVVPGTRGAHNGIVVEPPLAVECFQHELGDSFLRDLRTRSSRGRFTPEEESHVLVALNKQVSANGRLVENSRITYEGDPPTLHIGPSTISAGSWVPALLRALLHDGVLTRAPDARHLRLKSGLSVAEERKVEWLHRGLMNSIYGNSLEVGDYSYDRQLREHWYFRRR